MQTLILNPADVKRGDVFRDPETGKKGWTALTDATPNAIESHGRQLDVVTIFVMHHPDGGTGPRHFDPKTHPGLTIERGPEQPVAPGDGSIPL